MAAVLDRFYFPPPVDIDTRRGTTEIVAAIAAQVATQPDLAPIRTTAENTALQLQQQQQNENSGGSGGVNKVLTFDNSGAALNTTDWTASGYLINASNQMALAGSTPNGFYLARANYVYATDDQAAIAQLGSEQNNDQYTFIVLRANNSGTQGVACRISASGIAIGTMAYNGDGAASSGFQSAQSTGRSLVTGDSIEFRAVGNVYSVYVNGGQTPALQYTGFLGSTGSSWRSASVIKQRAQGAFGIVFYSFNIRSFGMYDYGTAGTAVSARVGAKVTRLATAEASLTVGNGAAAAFPANFFSTQDFAQNVVITDAGTAKFTVQKSTWYRISCSFLSVYQVNSGPAYYGVMPSFWGLVINGTVQAVQLQAGMTLDFPLAAGDVVYPCILAVGHYTEGGDSSTSTRAMTLTGVRGGPGAFFQIIED